MALEVSADGTQWFATAATAVFSAATGVRVGTLVDNAFPMARGAVVSGSAASVDVWICAN